MSHELHNLVTKIENACDSESYEVADTEHLVRLAVAEYVVAQNGLVASARVVDPTAVQKVIDRHIRENISAADPQTWFANVATKVADFLELAYEDRTNNESAEHVDLLPIGHPRNIKNLGLTASARMQAVAEWVAADPRITSDLGRQAVYNAYRAKPESLEATYANAKIEALAASGVLPADFAYEAIVASFKNMSFAERSARSKALAAVRRRDRWERFANEFGRLRGFFSKGDGTMFSATGKIAGAVPGENKYYVEYDGSDPEIPKGVYVQDAGMSENVRATLSSRVLKNATNVRKSVAEFDKRDQSSAVDLQSFLATKVESPGDWTKNEDGSFSSNTGNKVKEVDSLPEGDYYFEGVGENNEQDLGESLFEIRDSNDELIGVAQDWNGIQKIALTHDKMKETEAKKAPEVNDATVAEALDGLENEANWDDPDGVPSYDSPNGILSVSFNEDADTDGEGGMRDASFWSATLDPEGEAIDLGTWGGSPDDDFGDIAERVSKAYEEYKAQGAELKDMKDGKAVYLKDGKAVDIKDADLPDFFKPKEGEYRRPVRQYGGQWEETGSVYENGAWRKATKEEDAANGVNQVKGYNPFNKEPDLVPFEPLDEKGLGQEAPASSSDEIKFGTNGQATYTGSDGSKGSIVEDTSKVDPEKGGPTVWRASFTDAEGKTVNKDFKENDKTQADSKAAEWLQKQVDGSKAAAFKKENGGLSEKQLEPASPKQYALLKEFQEERDGIDENQNQAINDALANQNLSKAQMAALFGDLQKKPFKPEIDPNKPSDRMINSLRDYLTNKELTPDEINSALDELEAGLDRAGVEKLLAKLRRRPDKAKEEGLGQDIPSELTPQDLANGYSFSKQSQRDPNNNTWVATGFPNGEETFVEVTQGSQGRWFTTEYSGGNGESGFTRESEKQHATAQEAFEYAGEVAQRGWDQDLYEDLRSSGVAPDPTASAPDLDFIDEPDVSWTIDEWNNGDPQGGGSRINTASYVSPDGRVKAEVNYDTDGESSGLYLSLEIDGKEVDLSDQERSFSESDDIADFNEVIKAAVARQFGAPEQGLGQEAPAAPASYKTVRDLKPGDSVYKINSYEIGTVKSNEDFKDGGLIEYTDGTTQRYSNRQMVSQIQVVDPNNITPRADKTEIAFSGYGTTAPGFNAKDPATPRQLEYIKERLDSGTLPVNLEQGAKQFLDTSGREPLKSYTSDFVGALKKHEAGLKEQGLGQAAPSTKMAEDATDAQYNYISSMLNGKEVPEELATAAKQAIEDRNLSKAQVGEIIGKMRDLPNKEGYDPNAPTERMIESVKRNIVAKGLSQEDQDAILQDLPNMDKATMSELIGRLKAMDDVNAPEEGLGQQSVNDLDAEVEDIALELDSEGVGGPFVSGKGLRRSIEDFISDKYRKYASIRMQSVNDIRDLAADIKDGNLSQRLNNLADKLKAELVETFGIAEVAKTNDENDEIYLDDVRDSIEADKGMYFETDANVLADKLESDLAYGDSKSGGAEVFVYQEEDGTWTATVDYDRDSEEFKSKDRDEVIQQAAAAAADYNRDVIPSSYSEDVDLDKEAQNAKSEEEALAFADKLDQIAEDIGNHRGDAQQSFELRDYAQRIRDLVAKRKSQQPEQGLGQEAPAQGSNADRAGDLAWNRAEPYTNKQEYMQEADAIEAKLDEIDSYAEDKQLSELRDLLDNPDYALVREDVQNAINKVDADLNSAVDEAIASGDINKLESLLDDPDFAEFDLVLKEKIDELKAGDEGSGQELPKA